MAALIELQEHASEGSFPQSGDSSEDVEALGRSYVCSMSSVVDLDPPMDGNYGDFLVNIQRYLARIVEELHLISAWSSSISHFQQPTNRLDESSFTAMARLAVVTDVELLRRDVAKAQLELSQRCATQLQYAQSEASTAASKQETLYNELKQRMDDKRRVLAQQTQAIQTLEKTHAERETQIRSMASTMRQVQQQTSTRFSELEKALAAATTAQFTHEQELQSLERRLEGVETAHQLHVEASRRATEDSLTGLRAANAQLASKMQVLRLEIQELDEQTQKRMQQLMQTVSAVAANVSGKPLMTTVAPRRPSEAPRPPTDCFIYAKAALPHRSSTSSATTIKTPLTSSRVLSPSSTSEMKAQLSMDLLTVQQSSHQLSRLTHFLAGSSTALHTLPFFETDDTRTSSMSTPDTVGAISRNTPFNDQLLVLRTAERQTPSTVTLSYGNYSSIASWSSVDRNDNEGEHEHLPTFEACSSAIITAAERMVVLTRQPHSLAVAIAYDECMDIITAAIAHMEQIESQGDLSEGFLDVYRAMRNVRETLRPSSVRRSLQF